MEFLLVFSEANFVEVPKIFEICKIYGPQKAAPYNVTFLIPNTELKNLVILIHPLREH